MILTVQASALSKALAAAQGFTSSSIPGVLDTYLLSADQEGLRVRATDLSAGFEGLVEAQVQKPGSICVPAKRFHQLLRELPCDEVRLEVTDNLRLSVRTGSVRVTLCGVNPEEFPSIFPDATDAFRLPGKVLSEVVQKVSFCASKVESPMGLHGVLIEGRQKGERTKIVAVATDGHRLALMGTEAEGKYEGKMLLGHMDLRRAVRALERADAVNVRAAESVCVLEAGNRRVAMRLLEHTYPEFRQVLPKDHPSRALIDREGLLGAARRAAIVAEESGVEVRAGRTFEISVETEQGVLRESLEAEEYQGEEVSFRINPRYLAEGLQAIRSDRVRIELKDPDSVVVLKPADESEKYIHLIMPMRRD